MRKLKQKKEQGNNKGILYNEAAHTAVAQNHAPVIQTGYDFSRVPLQAKLTVNTPGDKYEQEADAMADKVTRTNNDLSQHKAISAGITPLVQTKTESTTPSVSAALNNKVTASQGGGSFMDNETGSSMSNKFGVDFSNVKIHTDNEAVKMNNELNAKAFTVGRDIYFNEGEFNPQSNQGRQLLAHELTHVVQQNSSSKLAGAAIQRDDDTDASDAKLNFKDDWNNYFSNYNKLIKIDTEAANYVKEQKKGITATKKDDLITVTLGKPYATEEDEPTRKKWIKEAIIDKFVKADRFEELGYDPTHSKLDQLNPPDGAGVYCSLNCPATAASLDEYLRTGTVNKAFCDTSLEQVPGFGFVVSKNTFTKPLDWKKAKATITKQLKKHGDFVIIEATRNAKQMANDGGRPLAETHYFSVVNIHGQLFAIDAFGGGIVSDNIDAYNNTRVKATSYKLVIGEFKVTPYIPKP